MSNTYGFDYKVLEGDNYEKLANIFGISALTNAGIFPDSDIKTNSVIKFRNLYQKDAEFLNKKGNDHTNEYNRARDLKFIKENRHYLNTEGFQQGISDMLQKSDEELIPIYKGILSRAQQEEKARAVQAEKSRIQAERSKERAEHNARLRAQGIVNEETAQYSPEMKHHKGREQIAAVTNNYNNPMARGAGVVSKDVDLSFEGSMENLENQHKITEEIKDLTQKAAFGAVGLAGATALAPIVAPAVVDSVAVNGASTVANNPIVQGVTNKLVKPVGNFVLKQIPWIAGSHAANKGLDVIAGNTKDHYDPEHWANNRYIRGGATAIGMAGGTAGAKLIGGTGKVALGTATGKYGLDYAQNLIARYFRNVGKNTIGQFIPSLFTMEGLAASNHVMDTVEEKRKNENKDNLEYIQNEEYKISPYARAAVNTVGMWLGHNASRSTLQQTKDIIGNEINSAIKNAVKFESEGNLQAAQNYIQRALKLERTLNNGLFSKALDLCGAGCDFGHAAGH